MNAMKVLFPGVGMFLLVLAGGFFGINMLYYAVLFWAAIAAIMMVTMMVKGKLDVIPNYAPNWTMLALSILFMVITGMWIAAVVWTVIAFVRYTANHDNCLACPNP